MSASKPVPERSHRGPEGDAAPADTTQSLAGRTLWRSPRAANERAWWAVISLSAFIALWQLVGANVDPVFLSTPWNIVKAVPKVMERDLFALYGITMGVYLGSVSIAVVLGALTGLACGMNASFDQFSRPVVAMCYSTPTIVTIPILVIWFGDGLLPGVVLVFIAAYFPMLFNTQLGVREVGPDMLELGTAFGATRSEMIAKIIVPSLLPYAFSGLKIAIPRGFIAVIAAEMLITGRGTGSLVLYYGDAFQTDRFFVPVILLTITAYLISEALHATESHFMPWRFTRE